ncbi:MAG: MATE family efflux transporter [Acetobacteraceae bacterium]
MSGAAVAVPPPSNVTLLRRIYRLAAPTTLVVVLQVIGQLTETWLAARQGTAALAGWAVVLPFALLMNMASAGAMGGGVVSAVARALGAKQPELASALVLHAVLIALAAGGLFMVLLAGMPYRLFSLIAGPETAAEAAPYAMWLFGAGAVPVWLTNTLASVLRGGGRHGLASRVLSTGGAVSPFLAWFLMEPCGAGLKGAGMAVAIVFAVSAVAMAIPVLRGAAGFVPNLRLRPRAALFRQILAVGLVASMMAAIANLTTILVTAQIAPYGPTVVAAYGISARLEFLMIPLAFGIGSALTALVGQAVGAGDWTLARRTAWAGGCVALCVAGSVGFTVALLPEGFARLFTADAAVVAVATQALTFVAPACAGFGIGMALYFASMGAARMKGPVIAAFTRISLAVFGGWVLANGAGMGLAGHFLAVALGITAYGAIMAAAVRPAIWRG